MFLKRLCFIALIVSVYCHESTFINVTLSADDEETTIGESNSLKEFLPNGSISDLIIQGIIPILHENSVVDIVNVTTLTFELNEIEDIRPGAFKNFQGVKTLRLWKNNLTVIRKNVFNQVEVEKLDVSYNPELEIIEDGALDNPHIETLIFLGNKLRNFDKNVFRKLPKLKTLSLAENGIETLQKEAFEGLPLTLLDLNFNPLVTLPDFLLDLKQLSVIGLISNKRLTQIPKGVFNNHPTLQMVILLNNNISSIDPQAFDNMSQLNFVDLHSNELIKIDNNWFHNTPKLRKVDLSQNYIEEIPSEAFKNLEDGPKIDLRENRIKKIAPDAFKGFKKIDGLSLSNNTLETLEGSYLSDVDINNFYLNDNEIKCPEGDFAQVFKAKATYLQGNPLTTECLEKISEWKGSDSAKGHLVDVEKMHYGLFPLDSLRKFIYI